MSQNVTPVTQEGFTFTFANGGYDSNVLDVQGNTLCGVFIPAAYSGTNFTVYGATSSSATPVVVYKNGGELSYSVPSGANAVFVPINPNDVAGLRFIMLKSNTLQSGACDAPAAVRYV